MYLMVVFLDLLHLRNKKIVDITFTMWYFNLKKIGEYCGFTIRRFYKNVNRLKY